jgi:hypothetical protein
MSYNSLFGLGSHSGNHATQLRAGWWRLQENAATNAVADSGGYGNNGTLSSGNTDAIDIAGPTSYLASALTLSSVTVSIPDAASLDATTAMTVIGWMRRPTGVSTIARKYVTTGNQRSWQCTADLSTMTLLSSTDGTSAAAVNNSVAANTLAANTWGHFAFVLTGGNFTPYRNNVVGTPTSNGNLFSGTAPVVLGGGNVALAGVGYFLRGLSDAEVQEGFLGPEPLNTVAPAAPTGTQTVGEVLTASTGTWDSQSNGTITYSYQWTRSDDGSGTGEADISGATASTYILIVADIGKFIRCRVRASNDGGFDAAEDTNSNFSGAIAAAGGSVVQSRRRRQLVGAGL